MESLLKVLGRTLRPGGRSPNTSEERRPDQMPEPPRSAPFAPRISDSTLSSHPLKLIPATVRRNEEPHSGRPYRRPCELAGSGQVAPRLSERATYHFLRQRWDEYPKCHRVSVIWGEDVQPLLALHV